MWKGLAIALMLMVSSIIMAVPGGSIGTSTEGPYGIKVLVWHVPEPKLDIMGNHCQVTVPNWGTGHQWVELPERSYYLPLGVQDHPEIIDIETTGQMSEHLALPLLEAPIPIAGLEGWEGKVEEVIEQEPIRDMGLLEQGENRFWVLRISPFRVEGPVLYWPQTIKATVATGCPGSVQELVVPEDLPQPTEYDEGIYSQPLWSQEGPADRSGPTTQASYTDRFPPTECLIITTSTYNSTLRPLAEWKTMRGVPTRIVETGWISTVYSGSDTQEKVRNCIKAFYTNENLKWVIIGGDHSVVPSRMAYVPDGYDDGGSDGNTIPADSYYGDISGSGATPYDWDGDNDGNYGEYSVDGIDLSSEVWVGRLSVSTTNNMQTLVNNILNYEKNPPSGGWYNRSVLAGAYSNYKQSSTSNDTTDEATLKEAIRTDFLAGGGYNTYTLYEKGGIWPSQKTSNASLTNSNVVSAIDPGAFMVNLAGHGSYLGIYRRVWNSDTNGNKLCDSGETSDYVYYSTSASQTNGGKKPLFYNDACNNGEFDRTTCLTEDILLDVGIGAIGAGRVSWYSKPWSKGSDGGWYNQGHDYRFWQQFFAGNYQPGKALALSKYDYIQDKTAHDQYVWKNLLQYNLMGDPEIPIWTKRPGTLSISHNDPVPAPGTYTFTVTDGLGNPVNGAKVCLMNLTEFYGTAVTGSDGKCSITLPQIIMKMNLTVTAHNFKPLVKSVSVGTDMEKPRLVSVAQLGTRTTGDNFKINAVVTDNVEVSSVRINYNWSNAQPSMTYNSSMIKAGPINYTFIYSHPKDRVTEFWYSIGARDAKGNWNHSAWYHFSISDNDLPVLVLDNSTTSATTGDPFLFEVHLSDNVGVGTVSVNYTLTGMPAKNTTMTGLGNVWSMYMYIPNSATGNLVYHIWFNDTSGNVNETTDSFRSIIDDDGPVFMGDNTVLPPTTGDPFIVNVSVMDNIAVFEVRLVYSIGGLTDMNQSMQRGTDGNYTRLITIGPAVDTNITYHVYARDTSNNLMITDDIWIDILDNDLPYLTWDASDPVPTTGEPFNFSLKAGDNKGVTDVWVEWGSLEEWGTERFMERADYDAPNGEWYKVWTVPTSMSGHLTYRFDIADAAGNHFLTEWVNRSVKDNIPPWFAGDLEPEERWTGGNLRFRCQVQDNWDNVSVKVNIEIQYYISFALEMDPTGGSFYEKDWAVPIDRMGELTYWYFMEDLSGNINVSEMFSFVIVDSLPPTCNLSVDQNYTTGEMYLFIASPQDNIGVRSVELQIDLPGSTENVMIPMEFDEFRAIEWHQNLWLCDFTMPSDRAGPLRIRVVFNDSSGNEGASDWIDAELIDNDAPGIEVLSAPAIIGTGSTGSIYFLGSDNIQISGTNVTYIDGPLKVVGKEMLDNGTIKVEVEAPSDSVGTANLILSVDDGIQTTNATITIAVFDDDAPTLDLDPILPQYGLDVSIPVVGMVWDNVGVVEVVLVITSGEGLVVITSGEGLLDIVSLVPVEGRVSFIFNTTGPMDLRFDVTVSDAYGHSVMGNLTTVVIDDKAPIVGLKDKPTEAKLGEEVILDASGTSDSVDDLNYTWKVKAPDGTIITLYGQRTSFVPDQEGKYRVSLTVTDPSGNRAAESMDIVVRDGDPNENPIILYGLIALVVLALVLLLVFFLVRSRRKGTEKSDIDQWSEE